MAASSNFIRASMARDYADEKLLTSHGCARPCPACGNSIARVRSRPMDRLVALFHPVYRYKCYDDRCSWQGRLPSVRVIDEEICI